MASSLRKAMTNIWCSNAPNKKRDSHRCNTLVQWRMTPTSRLFQRPTQTGQKEWCQICSECTERKRPSSCPTSDSAQHTLICRIS